MDEVNLKKDEVNGIPRPNLADISVGQILYALSDPSRLKIVQLIDESGGELTCGAFIEKIKVAKSTLSHHFGVLRQCGIIATRFEGTQKFNSLRVEELNERFPGLLPSILKSIRKKKKSRI